MSWTFGYNNEITAFLKTKRDAFIKKFANNEHNEHNEYNDFEPYFLKPEMAFEDDIRQYGPCSIAVFRSLGYTMGHVVLDQNGTIIDIIVYDREKIKDYKEKSFELEKELKSRFLGIKLVFEEK